jgi:hypothetical protein
MQPQEAIGHWKVDEKKFRQINHNNTKKKFFYRGFAAITNGFENRIRKLELGNCLLSGSARKVDVISETFDGRETESEIINKTPL